MPQNQTLIAVSHGTDSEIGAAAISRLIQAAGNQIGKTTRVVETYVDVQYPQVDAVLSREAAEQPNDSFVIVPLLLSTGYHVRQDIASAAYETGKLNGAKVAIAAALGPDQRLVEVLVARLREQNATAEDLIVLCSAGSSDPRAVAEVELVQTMLEEALTSLWQVPVKTELAYLSAAEPKLKDLVARLKFKHPRKRVIVSTYLLAPGVFADKTRDAGAHLATDPLLSSQGEPPAELIELIIERFKKAQSRSGQTGCLDGLMNREFQGCAAGCQTSCRKPA